MALMYLYKEYAMFDYNFSVSFVSLVIVYLEIKNQQNNKLSYQIFIRSFSRHMYNIKTNNRINNYYSFISLQINRCKKCTRI